MSIDLKCCPFCSSSSLDITDGDFEGAITCNGCGAMIRCRSNKNGRPILSVIERWNIRAKSSEQPVEQPKALTLEYLKNLGADPKVQDAIRNPANPFSVAWHKREEEHRKALAEVTKRESGWQPIETAPKDGTAIMIVSDFSDLHIDEASFTNGQWWSNKLDIPVTPEWWMPLPKKPHGKR
jgi:hypothetical protein